MLVLVGGHSRNIGKTSVVEGIIRALPEAGWTAVKVTQYGHGVCSAQGEPCDCTMDYDHPYAITEETADGPSDSGRFKAAGARHAYWVRTPVGGLGNAIPSLREILGRAPNAIVESNSLLQFLIPDLYLAVVDGTVEDWKESARRYVDRVDGFVIVNRSSPTLARFRNKPMFVAAPPEYVTSELVEFVSERLSAGRRERAL